LKEEIDGVKQTMKDVEKSLEGAWAAIEDVQQETKTYKDSKSSHQKMLDDQAQKTQHSKGFTLCSCSLINRTLA